MQENSIFVSYRDTNDGLFPVIHQESMYELAHAIYTENNLPEILDRIAPFQFTNAEISDADFEQFVTRMKAKREPLKIIVRSFQKQHNLKLNEAHALLMMRLIKRDNLDKHDLFRQLSFLSVHYRMTPLAIENKDGETVISLAIQHYIHNHLRAFIHWEVARHGKRCSFKMSDKVLANMVQQLTLSDSILENHSITLIEELLEPIYDEESIERLKDTIGRDWLDSYYF